MDNLGDLFGGVGEMFGGMFADGAAAEGAMGFAELLSPDGRREQRNSGMLPIAYERYLCGGPHQLHINDR